MTTSHQPDYDINRLRSELLVLREEVRALAGGVLRPPIQVAVQQAQPGIPAPAVKLHFGEGVPSDNLGEDRDYYFEVDGVGGRAVYHKEGGAWVGAGGGDHGSLTGRGDDDHTHYVLADGSRDITGDQSFGNSRITHLTEAQFLAGASAADQDKRLRHVSGTLQIEHYNGSTWTSQIRIDADGGVRMGNNNVFNANSSSVEDVAFLALSDGVTDPATQSGQARMYVDNSDGNLKIIFGDGTSKTIVTDS